MILKAKLGSLNERLRDLGWACLVTVLLTLSGVLDPINQLTWAIQSTVNREPFSGDIIFATSQESVSDPSSPQQRILLAKRLEELAQSNVDHVYIDAVFDRPSTPQADRALANAIAGLGERVSLVLQLTNNATGELVPLETLPEIKGSTNQVTSLRYIEYTGFTWKVPGSLEFRAKRFDNFPVVLAGQAASATDTIDISYNFEPGSLPLLNLDTDIGDQLNLTGKSVVIGNPASGGINEGKIPGFTFAPRSYTFIYAAETLKSGFGKAIPEAVLIGLLLTLLLGLVARASIKRRMLTLGYSLIGIALPVYLSLATMFHVRVSIAGGIALLSWYAFLRIRVRWQKRFALTDAKTGLPTFRALEQRIRDDISPAALIVAKIHGYENVVKTLPAHLHADYIRSLMERFRVADPELAIYANEGRYFSWISSIRDQSQLEAHLDGLRALFSAPIVVGGVEVDAGITFGIDMSSEPDSAQRIASAVSVAELTDEAHQPILFTRLDEQSDALWKLSLQARIDNALENREIYLVYQPKVDLETGEMTGCEALVRWNDPARGEISPAYFVQECERAGRMDHLTEYVLSEAVTAAVELQRRGIHAKMSVNISATLLRGDQVESMLRNALKSSGLEASLLVIEITETARIVDIEKAIRVLNRVRALGVGVSIDDFGVGAANLETIYRLPFDELKIDRVFISNLADRKAAGIVKSMIEFGKALRINIVAEGAEDAETIEELRNLGCRIVQGYGISRPLEFAKLLEFQSDRVQDELKNVV